MLADGVAGGEPGIDLEEHGLAAALVAQELQAADAGVAHVRDEALAVLQPAVTVAAREGYVRLFVDVGPKLIPLLRQIAAQGIAPEFVGTLLTSLGSEERGARPVPGTHGETLVEPLSDSAVSTV